MSVDSEDARERSEAKLKRAQETARERESARADYEAQAQATRDNMARLKALRLAQKAAADRTEPVKTGAARRKRRSP